MFAYAMNLLRFASAEEAAKAAAEAPPACGVLVLPFLGPERAPGWKASTLTMSGIVVPPLSREPRLLYTVVHRSTTGVTRQTSAGQVMRACLEGVTYRLALILRLLRPFVDQNKVRVQQRSFLLADEPGAHTIACSSCSLALVTLLKYQLFGSGWWLTSWVCISLQWESLARSTTTDLCFTETPLALPSVKETTSRGVVLFMAQHMSRSVSASLPYHKVVQPDPCTREAYRVGLTAHERLYDKVYS